MDWLAALCDRGVATSGMSNINTSNNLDDELVNKAIAYARVEHEKVKYASFSHVCVTIYIYICNLQIMALLNPISTKTTSTTPAPSALAAIAQLAPAHLVGNTIVLQRIYVGSVQFDISEKDLCMLFGQFGPVQRIDMIQDPVHRRHKGYGFLEFETPEAAALAQAQMDGAYLGGRTVKVGRPSNYPADLPPGVPRPLPNRIYVGNVHEQLGENDVRSVFEAFGTVRYCHLTLDPATGGHKGYGYVEYECEQAANSAIASLNNFELAKKSLKVGKTIVGGPMPPGLSDSRRSSACVGERPKVPTAVLRAVEEINANLAGTARPSVEDTSVMFLRNLEDYANLQSPNAISELERDVTEECLRFGDISICKAHMDHAQKTVSVFVKFSDRSSLPEALRVMHLRWFGGRQILAEPFDEQLFDTVYHQQHDHHQSQ